MSLLSRCSYSISSSNILTHRDTATYQHLIYWQLHSTITYYHPHVHTCTLLFICSADDTRGRRLSGSVERESGERREKTLSVAERIFKMQSRVEEDKFTPRMAVSGSVTPRSKAGPQFFRSDTLHSGGEGVQVLLTVMG